MDIIVSIGPTLITKAEILFAIINGATIFRFPLGYDQDYPSIAKNIRLAEVEANKKVRILLDFPSSRPRFKMLSQFEIMRGGLILVEKEGSISIDNFDLFIGRISNNMVLSSQDGLIKFRVENIEEKSFSMICTDGYGSIKSGCSLSIQSDKVDYELITEKELRLLEKLVNCNIIINNILFSFSEATDQLIEAKKTCERILNYTPDFFAKIESKEGVFHLGKIADHVSGIMLGRGDLMSSVSDEFLAFAQEEVARVCLSKRIKAIVATKILTDFSESGKMSPSEINGLSLFVKQGYSGFMLGKETVWSQKSQESIVKLKFFLEHEFFKNKLLRLSLPLKTKINKIPVIAIEGSNGIGKTTIVKMIAEHYCFSYNSGVPTEFLNSGMKYRMIVNASWEASFMYFLSGAAEKLRELENVDSSFVVIDRSFWSTLSVHASFDINRLETILNIIKCFSVNIFEPSFTIILRSSFEQCRKQILMKTDANEIMLDELVNNDLFYQKEQMFYDWLTLQRNNVINIDVSNKDRMSIFREIINVIDGLSK